MTTILFVHGLESGPQGSKSTYLQQQGHRVIAPDMQMSMRRLDRPNSALRNALRTDEVRVMAMAGAGALALAAAWRSRRLAASMVGVGTGWALVRAEELMRQGLSMSLEQCVALQSEAIETHAPDLVIGSSWGGAVAMELVRRNLWSGPTLLIAPAYRKLAHGLGWWDVERRERHILQEAGPTLIVHDPEDEVVPYAHSEALRSLGFDLQPMDAGGHRMIGLLHGRAFDRAIERVMKGKQIEG